MIKFHIDKRQCRCAIGVMKEYADEVVNGNPPQSWKWLAPAHELVYMFERVLERLEAREGDHKALLIVFEDENV